MKKETEAREGNVFKRRSCHGRSRPHTVLPPVGSQSLITLLSWALECPSPYTTRLQTQAEEKALVDSPPLSKQQEQGPQGKHLCQGQGARPRLGKLGLVEAAVPLPVHGWASPHPHSARPCRALLGGARREAGRERQEASRSCRGAILLGREIKRNIKESQGVWRGAWWIKFSSSWERR